MLDLGRDHHISHAALEGLLKELSAEDLPEAFSSRTQQRHRQKEAYQQTTFGPLCQCIKVETDEGLEHVWVQHPFGFLEAACKRSEPFRRLLTRVLDRTRNTVRLVAYSDEITPGNPLKEVNGRKLEAIYWSILDFQFPTLSNEQAWMTACVCRSDLVLRLKGGMSQLFRIVLKVFFGAPLQPDLRTGVELNIFGEAMPRILRGSLAVIIQDERAFKFSMEVMGATGIKLCALCQNVVSFKCNMAQGDRTGYTVPSTELDASKFKLHSNASIRGVQDRLTEVEATRGTTARKELETLLGYKFNPESLLQDKDLAIQVADVWAYDWMHNYLVGGVFIVELDAALDLLEAENLGGATLHEYFKLWTWPGGYASGKGLCKKVPSHEASGSASEYMSAAPVIRKYMLDVVLRKVPRLQGAVDSMVKLCDVLPRSLPAQGPLLQRNFTKFRATFDALISALQVHSFG